MGSNEWPVDAKSAKSAWLSGSRNMDANAQPASSVASLAQAIAQLVQMHSNLLQKIDTLVEQNQTMLESMDILMDDADGESRYYLDGSPKN